MDQQKNKVAIVMGSKSDKTIMDECSRYLDFFGISNDEYIFSAHRAPEQTSQFAKNAKTSGYTIIIAAAGMAAHLPGVIAAYTNLPVIGVPLAASSLNGIDALLSIVQMPGGVPVATMSIGKAGAINAAVYAARILSATDKTIEKKLIEFQKMGCKLPKQETL